MNNLSAIDRKILYELDKNSRQPFSVLAKKLRMSRTALEYRVKQLQEKNILKQFVTLVRPNAFGYQYYKIYLQLQNLNSEKEEKLIKYIQTLPLYWMAKCYGKWDLLIGVMAKSPREFNNIELDIMSKFGDNIANKNITTMVETPHFRRDYLISGKHHEETLYVFKGLKENIKLDDIDKKILDMLSQNARTTATEISNKTGITVKTAINRIKQLEVNGVIYGYKITLNLGKIGYKYMKAFVSLKNVNKEDYQRFIAYCTNIPNVSHIVECIGEWDFEPEFEVENEEKFFELLTGLRNEFSNIIKSVETITIVKEYEYKLI